MELGVLSIGVERGKGEGGVSVCTGTWASPVFRACTGEPRGRLLVVPHTWAWHCHWPHPGSHLCRETFTTDAGTFDFKQE